MEGRESRASADRAGKISKNCNNGGNDGKVNFDQLVLKKKKRVRLRVGKSPFSGGHFACLLKSGFIMFFSGL